MFKRTCSLSRETEIPGVFCGAGLSLLGLSPRAPQLQITEAFSLLLYAKQALNECLLNEWMITQEFKAVSQLSCTLGISDIPHSILLVCCDDPYFKSCLSGWENTNKVGEGLQRHEQMSFSVFDIIYRVTKTRQRSALRNDVRSCTECLQKRKQEWKVFVRNKHEEWNTLLVCMWCPWEMTALTRFSWLPSRNSGPSS